MALQEPTERQIVGESELLIAACPHECKDLSIRRLKVGSELPEDRFPFKLLYRRHCHFERRLPQLHRTQITGLKLRRDQRRKDQGGYGCEDFQFADFVEM